MADANAAAAVVLFNEDQSGKGKITKDAGGVTKWGIASRWYPSEDVPNMTAERAKSIFIRDFWKPLKLDGVKSQQVANSIFDFAVNAGVSRSRSTIRAVTGSKRTGAAVAADIAEINAVDPNKFLVAFGNARKGFYQKLVKDNPAQGVNLAGWITRAEAFYKNITRRQLVLVGLPVGALILITLTNAGRKWKAKKTKAQPTN